jgi:predicted nucleic acid-binding protein
VRAFLDASVLIFAVERPLSNSAKIVKAALGGRIDAVVDEEILREVARFFRRRRGRSFAWLYTEQIRRVASVVMRDECKAEFTALRGQLKEGDRLHLAAARASGTPHLIAFDADFKPFHEYLTPRQAARRLGLTPSETEW